MIEIRPALVGDCPGIARVQVDSFRDTFTGLLPDQYLEHFSYQEQEQDWRDLFAAHSQQVLYVAGDPAGVILAYGLGKPNSDEILGYDGELVALHVRRAHQHRGFGRQLFAAVSRELAARDCGSLFLWVLDDNPAHGFYQRLGGEMLAVKPWRNNSYFGTKIRETAYGWPDISRLF